MFEFHSLLVQGQWTFCRVWDCFRWHELYWWMMLTWMMQDSTSLRSLVWKDRSSTSAVGCKCQCQCHNGMCGWMKKENVEWWYYVWVIEWFWTHTLACKWMNWEIWMTILFDLVWFECRNMSDSEWKKYHFILIILFFIFLSER